MLFISILVTGCGTSRVSLSTHYPQSNEYDLSFGWRLVDDISEKSLTQKEREDKYKSIINMVLKNDRNTSKCSIINNSFHYFEPGCCAAAKVICQEPIDFNEASGTYNSEGMPLYFYQVQ